MGHNHFSKGVTFEMQGQVYMVHQILLDERRLLENLTNGGEERVSHEDLLAAYGRGEIRFIVKGPNTRRTTSQRPATDYTFADFRGLGAERDEAWRRYTIIRSYLTMSRQQRGQALRNLKEERRREFKETQQNQVTKKGNPRKQPSRSSIGEGDSPRSIERWLSAFLKSNGDIRALVPAPKEQGGRGRTRLHEDIETIIDEVIEEERVRVAASFWPAVSIDHIRDKVIIRVGQTNKGRSRIVEDKAHVTPYKELKPPSRDTIHARVKARGLQYILSRPLSTSESHADESTISGPRPTRVNERVEVDQTPLDLMVVDDIDRLPIGRPYITYAIDGYSRYPFGWYTGYEPNNYYTVGMCLLHGIVPSPDTRLLYETKHLHQSYGLMETLAIDRGRVFIGHDTSEACAEQGISLDVMESRSPWLKAHIERFIRSNNQGLVHYLPGTTFSNIIARGDYDPMKHACITLSAFRRIQYIYLLDIYAQKKHTGLRGIPARYWEAGVQRYPPALPNNIHDLRISFLSTEWRNLWHYGVDFQCIRYQDLSTLSALRKRMIHEGERNGQVKIKYSQADLSKIYVLDRFEQRWLPVPADREYTEYVQGLSLWKHNVIKDYAKLHEETADIYALASARLAIQKIVEEEFRLKGGKTTRKQAAFFLGIGTNVESDNSPQQPTDTQSVPPVSSTEPAPDSPDAAAMVSDSQDSNEEVIADNTPPDQDQKSESQEKKPKQSRQMASKKGTDDSLPTSSSSTTESPPRDRAGWGSSYTLPRASHPEQAPTIEPDSPPSERK